MTLIAALWRLRLFISFKDQGGHIVDLGLTGKVGLVTGGSRGIGRAIALRLAAEGVKVAICGRNSRKSAVSQRLRGQEGRARSTTKRSSMAVTSAAAYQVSPVTQRLVANSLSGSPASQSDLHVVSDYFR